MDHRFLSCLHIGELHSCHLLCSLYFHSNTVPDDFHILTGSQAVLQNPVRTELIPPVDNIHLLTDPCQENGILHCNIAAADHHSPLIFEKGTVTGCTVRNSHAGQFCLPRNIQSTVAGTAGQNHSFRSVFMLFCADDLLTAGILHSQNFPPDRSNSQLFRVISHSLSQIHP